MTSVFSSSLSSAASAPTSKLDSSAPASPTDSQSGFNEFSVVATTAIYASTSNISTNQTPTATTPTTGSNQNASSSYDTGDKSFYKTSSGNYSPTSPSSGPEPSSLLCESSLDYSASAQRYLPHRNANKIADSTDQHHHPDVSKNTEYTICLSSSAYTMNQRLPTSIDTDYYSKCTSDLFELAQNQFTVLTSNDVSKKRLKSSIAWKDYDRVNRELERAGDNLMEDSVVHDRLADWNRKLGLERGQYRYLGP